MSADGFAFATAEDPTERSDSSLLQRARYDAAASGRPRRVLVHHDCRPSAVALAVVDPAILISARVALGKRTAARILPVAVVVAVAVCTIAGDSLAGPSKDLGRAESKHARCKRKGKRPFDDEIHEFPLNYVLGMSTSTYCTCERLRKFESGIKVRRREASQTN